MKITKNLINNAQFELLSKKRSSEKIIYKLLERHLFLDIGRCTFFNKIVGEGN